MPIKKDLGTLPAAAPKAPRLPSKDPFILRPLVEHFQQEYYRKGEDSKALAIPEAGPFRASMASNRCDRQLYYALGPTEVSNPMTIADIWRVTAGSMVHTLLGDAYDVLNTALNENDPKGQDPRHWDTEVDVDLRTIGIPGSAHGDLIEFLGAAANTVVELKSINGFSFKMIATNFKGPAEGPRFGHIMQGLLVAAALGAPRLVIAYVSLELVSPDLALRYAPGEGDEFVRELARFAGEWHFSVPELQPLVDHEVKRVNRVLGLVAEEVLPAREIHEPGYTPGLTVFNPSTGGAHAKDASGTVVDTDKYWGCAYCAFRARCIADGPGAISTTEDMTF